MSGLQHSKGQVTIFMIIGILVVLAAVSFYLLRERGERLITGPPQLAPVPTEAEPINAFVTTCLASIAEDGLRRIGDHGGYIDPLASGIAYNPGQPTEGAAIQFAPGSDLIIPQWWYLEAENDCTGICPFNSRKPNLYKSQGEPSIEGQLEKFVQAQLPGCVGDFAGFRDQGFTIEPLGKPSVNATVAKDSVFFVLGYPLKVSRGGVEHEIPTYVAEFPDLPLRDIYTLASNLTALQAEHRYLENAMRQLIDGFSGVDSDLLPPVYDFVVSLSLGEFWTKFDVERKYRSLLEAYIPFVQVLGSRNYRVIQPPFGANVRDPENFRTLYNRGFLVPLEPARPNIAVTHAYLGWWNPYFNLNCRGQLCRPESILGTFGFIFGLQRYDFSYDISAPILVELTEPDALNKRGYSFKFFLEANMRSNAPMRADYRLRQQVEPFGRTLLCNPEQWTSDPVSITVLNGRGRKPLADATVTFKCGSETCHIATTGAGGNITTPLPTCLGGILGAEHEGMHPKFAALNTQVDGPQERTLILEPVRNLNVSVKKYQLKKGTTAWLLDAINQVSLKPDEETFITLTRETGPFDAPFTTFAVVNGDPSIEDHDRDIPFVPGKYKVELMTTKAADPAIVIPPRKKCVRKHSGGKKCFYIPPEPIEFNTTNPFPAGFATLTWEVSGEELDSGREITFHTVTAALDLVPESSRRLQDLDIITQTSDYAQEYAELLRPVVEQ